MAEAATPEQLAEALGEIKAEVRVKGRPRVITPLRTKQFFDALKCVHKLVEAGTVTLPAGGGAAEQAAALRSQFDPVRMAMCGGDQVIRIVSLGSGLSVSEVEGLDVVDMVKVTSAVFKVNLDFFSLHGDEIKDALAPLWEAVKGVTEGVTPGLPPSPGSPGPDTD